MSKTDWIAALAIVVTSSGAFAAGSDPAWEAAEEKRCAAVRIAQPFVFEGKTLQDVPELKADEIKLANALLHARCYYQAQEVIRPYRRANPADYQALFVEFRMLWMLQGAASARPQIESLARAKGFVSPKVLLASMEIGAGRLDTAARYLDEVQTAQPTDLWAFIDRLLIRAQVEPNPDLFAMLTRIARDQRFPPTARSTAAQTAQLSPNLDFEHRYRLMQLELTEFPSAWRLAELSEELLDEHQQVDKAVALLEKYRDCGCADGGDADALLAEGYLRQAAKLSNVPSARTRALQEKALKLMDGDLSPIASRMGTRPWLQPIAPYLEGHVTSRQPQEKGIPPLMGVRT